MRVGITGAEGLVGKCVVSAAKSAGYEIVPITSRRIEGRRAYKLGDVVSPDLFKGLDVVIHCGYDFGACTERDNERINVRGSLALLELAEISGVGAFIFISSMSAFENTVSVYGKGKLQVERAVLGSPIGIVLRLALIDSKAHVGILGKLRSIASKLPILPNLDSGRPTQYLVETRFIADFFSVLFTSLPRALRLKKPLIVAQKGPIRFDELMTTLWRETRPHGGKPRFFSLSSKLLLIVLNFAEFIRLPSGFRSDSLLGLINSDRTPEFGPFFEMLEQHPDLRRKVELAE